MNPEQELALLEEQVKETYGAYQDALNVTKELEGTNILVKEEITALTKQLESEQGNLTVYQERQTKAAALKTKCEQELAQANKVLASEIDSRAEMAENTKRMNGEAGVIKKDIEDPELALQRLEQEKTNRDHTIRGLNDEVAQGDEVINKLNKEKKHIADNQAKSSDDLQAASDKVTHLNGVKTKLEQTHDELEDGANREKRARGDVEKTRRKVEGELKMAQESVSDLEGAKRELENAISRKEKDILGLNSNWRTNSLSSQKCKKPLRKPRAVS